jgi:hypothetical protein
MEVSMHSKEGEMSCIDVLEVSILHLSTIFPLDYGNVTTVCYLWVFILFYIMNNLKIWLVDFMVFNATFNNISAISWRSVLLVEETRVPGENHRPVAVTDKLYHIVLYISPLSGCEPKTSVVIGTDYTGSCKSNYHTITATTAPQFKEANILSDVIKC